MGIRLRLVPVGSSTSFKRDRSKGKRLGIGENTEMNKTEIQTEVKVKKCLLCQNKLHECSKDLFCSPECFWIMHQLSKEFTSSQVDCLIKLFSLKK